MLFASLPNPNSPEVANLCPWGRETIVINDVAEQAAYGRHTAPLSLKTTLRGVESYNVHGFTEQVTAGDCLAVNAGQEYASTIDSHAPVQSLCIFFSMDDEVEARRAALTDEALADEPSLAGPAFEFAAVKRVPSETLHLMLKALPAQRYAPRLEQQSFSLVLLAAAMNWERPHWRNADALPALRATTRAELYRRCSIGRAYLEAMHADDVGLNDAAAAAGLSRTHFLRAYKACFGETPADSLRRIRLDRAAALLCNGKRSVSEIALAVGYSDFSAFARAFRARHGATPSSMRS